MMFVSPFLDVTRMSMSTVSFVTQLVSGIFCLYVNRDVKLSDLTLHAHIKTWVDIFKDTSQALSMHKFL